MRTLLHQKPNHYRTLFIFQFLFAHTPKAAFINICTPWLLLTKTKPNEKQHKGFNKQIFFISFDLHKKKRQKTQKKRNCE